MKEESVDEYIRKFITGGGVISDVDFVGRSVTMAIEQVTTIQEWAQRESVEQEILMRCQLVIYLLGQSHETLKKMHAEEHENDE
jgi:hypothetical protein